MKTKFNYKILLLVAILLISMCLFNTNTVQATDVATQEKELSNQIIELIPNEITLNIKESEALTEGDDNNNCKSTRLVLEKINSILKNNNIELPKTFEEDSTTLTLRLMLDFAEYNLYEGQAMGTLDQVDDIHRMKIRLHSSSWDGHAHGSSISGEKTITIKYSDTDIIKNNEEILNSLPDTINLDIKESEVDLKIGDIDNPNITLEQIKKNIKQQLADKNFDLSTLDVMFEGTDDDFYDIHRVYVNIGLLGYEKSKIIKVNYSNTAQYNKTDETYVKNKLDTIKFAKYEGIDAVFTIYNIGDEENANKWTFDTFDFNKLLNDNSITIKKIEGWGGLGGGTPWGTGACLYFYKNDILYATKFVLNYGAYGTTLENGTPVNMTKLEKDDEIYKTMATELGKNGLKNIIGCYELKAYGTTDKNMKVSFNLGSNYNGKEVKILHRKSDNTYETFTTTVADGKATITVNEFSPFMIALANTNTNTDTSKTDNNKVLDNEPKTGVADYTILASTIALISLAGISILKFKK